MNEILTLEIQRELQKFKHPSPLAISKEIVRFTNADKKKIDEIFKRISKNEPWEYIRGYTYFKKNKILVNPNVLIPRVETEKLVDLAIKKIKPECQIFDIGTGSGCISIALSKALNNDIFAIDIDKEALKIAEKNIALNKCKNIRVINADLLSFEFDNKKNTAIVANLPYLPSKSINQLEDSVKKHEPIIALDGGSDGCVFYKKLLMEIKKKRINLKFAIFEIDPSTSKYFKENNFQIKKDNFGRERFAITHPTLLK